MSNLYSNSIFWIDTDKIKPNPFQPRKDFDEVKLQELADSIKQYGVLQPLTVSRTEIEKEDGGIVTEYELIAGERRLRASKIAHLSQVPVIIRVGDNSLMKLELAILENLQREDLNAVDRARAFFRLANEFKFTHAEIAKKMGKSREHVSNSLRILSLPEELLNGLSEGKISEGHTRPLLMLADHPEEQLVLFKEIVYKKITVREAERLARKIAYDRVRKKEFMPDPEIVELEEEFQEKLGTRVHIDRKESGGQIKIDYFSTDDLRAILDLIQKSGLASVTLEAPAYAGMLERHIAKTTTEEVPVTTEPVLSSELNTVNENINPVMNSEPVNTENTEEVALGMSAEEMQSAPVLDIPLPAEEDEVMLSDDRSKEEIEKEEDTSIYNISNFSL